MPPPQRPKPVVKKTTGRPRTYSLDLPVYDTMEQCSGATGIPIAMLKLAKKQGCMFSQHSRCNLGMFLRWFFNREDNGEDDIDWTKRDKRAAALIKEAKLEETRNELVQFALVSSFIRHLVAIGFFAELERLKFEFPALLKGKDEIGIHEECVNQEVKIKKAIKTVVDTWIEKKGKV